MSFLIILILLIIIGSIGYVLYMYKKNETFIIPEISDINTKPIMPSINTSYFLEKEKEIKELGGEKITDFCITNIAYQNFSRGFFIEKENVYVIITQYFPNVIQKYFGIAEEPFVSIISVFDDGSELETTTRKNTQQEDISKFKIIEAFQEFPLTSLIEKHKIKIDFLETKNITAITLNKDDFVKHMKRSLKIQITHLVTKGYETKADLETILLKLGLHLKKEDNKESNKQE